MCALRHLGLLFMSTSQELHDHNVGFGHLQYTIHLLTTKNINERLAIGSIAAASKRFGKTSSDLGVWAGHIFKDEFGLLEVFTGGKVEVSGAWWRIVFLQIRHFLEEARETITSHRR